MVVYVPKALTRFHHEPPRIPQHQPYPHVKPTYGTKAQYTEDVDTSPPLDKKGKQYIQEVISTFLYYTRCINSTMLLALGFLAMQQSTPKQNSKKIVHQFPRLVHIPIFIPILGGQEPGAVFLFLLGFLQNPKGTFLMFLLYLQVGILVPLRNRNAFLLPREESCLSACVGAGTPPYLRSKKF